MQQIEREELMSVLLKLKPGLANSDIVDHSQDFIFDEAIIRTYNDEIAITHKFESGLSGAVPAKEFYNLFDKIPDETLRADQKDSKFIFKGKNKQITFNIDPDPNAPKIDILGPNSKRWKNLPNNFSEAVKACIFSAGKDMTLPALTGILVSGKSAISSDNWRATRVSLKSKMETDILIPAYAAIHLVKLNAHKFYLDKNWIHFTNKENIVFSCRQIQADYPASVSKIFNVRGSNINLPDELEDVLDRAQELITADEEYDKLATLDFKKNTITCTGSGIVGEYQEKVKTKYDDIDFVIMIPPALIIDIIKKMTVAKTNGKHLLFKGDGFEHVILLA